MQINLKDKTAVVCGSTQGIGKAIAFAFAEAGARVILVARNREKLEALCKELPGGEQRGHAWADADFSDNGAVQVMAAQIASAYHVNILVNNTGGPPAGPVHSANTEAFLQAFRSHLINNHQLVQAFLPAMKQTGYGRIINIISTSVKIPLHNLGVSNTIRGAVANWSKTLASELAPFGITVNNILPGATETERLSTIIGNKANAGQVHPDEIAKEMLAEIPMGRFGKPEEPAYAATFLASPFAAYITGTNVVVDGGRTGSL